MGEQTREEIIESWLQHIVDKLREARWQTAGDLYACKMLLIHRDEINQIETALDMKKEDQCV